MSDTDRLRGDDEYRLHREPRALEASSFDGAESTYRFASFTLEAFELLENAQPTGLGATPVAVLRVLVKMRPKVVTRRVLLTLVWGGDTHVTDNTVDVALSRIRRVLGDDPQQPHYIRTVHRRGWRFVAEVEEAPERVTTDSKV